jgi:hypothetical protein
MWLKDDKIWGNYFVECTIGDAHDVSESFSAAHYTVM